MYDVTRMKEAWSTEAKRQSCKIEEMSFITSHALSHSVFLPCAAAAAAAKSLQSCLTV